MLQSMTEGCLWSSLYIAVHNFVMSAHSSRLQAAQKVMGSVRIGTEYMELADTYQSLLVKRLRHSERFLCVLLDGGSFALGDQDLTR